MSVDPQFQAAVAAAEDMVKLCEELSDTDALTAASIFMTVRAGRAGMLGNPQREERLIAAQGRGLRHVFEAWNQTGKAPWE
jgi:hypothetical protein